MGGCCSCPVYFRDGEIDVILKASENVEAPYKLAVICKHIDRSDKLLTIGQLIQILNVISSEYRLNGLVRLCRHIKSCDLQHTEYVEQLFYGSGDYLKAKQILEHKQNKSKSS